MATSKNKVSEDLSKAAIKAAGAIVGGHASRARASIKDLCLAAQEVYSSLIEAAARTAGGAGSPPVDPADSIRPDYLVCLEDGRKLKMLKRYLKRKYGMTDKDYREKWGLPRDYPMVAPNYAKKRSAIAKKNGLGK